MSDEPLDSQGQLDLLILSVLAREPAHGYRIIAALRERSDGAFDLPEGTVYPALHRLESVDLVSSSWETADGRRRRIYEIKPSGLAILAARRESWQRFSRSVDAVLGWAP